MSATKTYMMDNYDQASVVCTMTDPEVQAEMQSVKTVSLEALNAVLDHAMVTQLRRMEAIIRIAERNNQMQYAQ
jgi:hypothetical protein